MWEEGEKGVGRVKKERKGGKGEGKFGKEEERLEDPKER